MAMVWIPSMMRDLTEGRDRISIQGNTVAEVIDALEKAHPGFKERLVIQGKLAPGIMVTVDGKRALRGLEQALDQESEVRFVPIMGGG